VEHTDFELDVDFERRVVEGHALLRVRIGEGGAAALVLDSRDLSIAGAALHPSGAPLAHAIGERHRALGAPLRIELPAGLAPGAVVAVGVRFTTSPGASALQFLSPAQTAGGAQPYLFTQCQAIHARSFVVCQDTPSAKLTYTAAVRVPAALRALMSAVAEDDGAPGAGAPLAHLPPPPPGAPATRVFRFAQAVPIPSYLLALAVGELESRRLSDRSAVWSEPSMVEAGAYEFAETSKFLDAAEAIAGPYVRPPPPLSSFSICCCWRRGRAPSRARALAGRRLGAAAAPQPLTPLRFTPNNRRTHARA